MKKIITQKLIDEINQYLLNSVLPSVEVQKIAKTLNELPQLPDETTPEEN